MKTDLYTKTILTVIAIFLGLNFLKEIEIIPTAKANTTTTAQTPPPTAIKNETVDVNISHIGGIPITTNEDNVKPIRYRKEINIYYGIPINISKNWDK